MGTKYTIEVEDKPFELLSEDGFTSEKLYRVKGFNSLVFDWNGLNMLTPYTEPDLDAIKQEEYEKGYKTAKVQCDIQAEKDLREVGERHYQKGLSDAWEAARKIQDTGGNLNWWIHNTSAFEAIEKIRQYEQEKEEIKVGDEVELDDGETAIWMRDNSDEDTAYLMFSDGSCGSNENSEIVRKTGRHFPEIAEVLRKMQEEE